MPVRATTRHLNSYGRDKFLNRSMIGGDPPGGYPEHGAWYYSDEEWTTETEGGNEEDFERFPSEDTDAQINGHHHVQQQFQDALRTAEELQEMTREAENIANDDEHPPELPDYTIEALELLSTQASRPLYPGSSVSLISAVVVLMTLCTTHGVSNDFVTELLHYLSEELLPEGNVLPASHYKAKRMLQALGLAYNVIHACPSGCVLFRGEHIDLESCPICGKRRYREGTKTALMKVVRHFPLVPRLRRMFSSPAIAKLLKWHSERAMATNDDGDIIMETVIDSPAWKHIGIIDPTFQMENRNVHMGLSLDGLNPFSVRSTSHSTWPVLLVIYNLPPWLVTKRFFIMMSILIAGKESPTDKNIDVFIAPLVEELQQLWDGVEAIDASAEGAERRFNLRGILLWTISDFPTYGLISGQQTKGYKACPICGPHIVSRSAKGPNGDKIVYVGARQRLPEDHAFREDMRFNGLQEKGVSNSRMTGEDVLQFAQERNSYLASGGRAESPDDPVRKHGVKRLSILFSLPYWKVSAQNYSNSRLRYTNKHL